MWLLASLEEYEDDKIIIATRERNIEEAKEFLEDYLKKRSVRFELTEVAKWEMK